MSNESEREYRVDERRGPLLRLLLTVRSSFIAFVAMLGVVFLATAVVLSEYVPGLDHGVLSGMLAVWGVSAFVYAALGHVGLRLIGYR